MVAPQEIESRYAPIASAVQQFAVQHSYQLDKCARGNTGWELVRAHALGGDVHLLLLYQESLGLGIGSLWWFPCPDMSLKYLHFRPIKACVIRPANVAKRLEDEHRAIHEVKFGYWTHIDRYEDPSGALPN